MDNCTNTDYEIIFTGAGEAVKKDADAICLRYKDEKDENGAKKYRVLIYDGGFESNAKAMQEFMNGHFFKGEQPQKIDYVIASHMDVDHVSGLGYILENYEVGTLYVNLPWNYIAELYEKVNDGRITKESLANRLKEKYAELATLEKIAVERRVKIEEVFAGKIIGGRFCVLSPSKEFFLENIAASAKIDFLDGGQESSPNRLEKIFLKAKEALLKMMPARWSEENLREDVETSAENETSIVLLGKMGADKNLLLTGDAGVQALKAAIDKMEEIGITSSSIEFYQIPHHGSKHNISPSILNSLVGPKVSEDETTSKVAFVSTAKGSDHPRKIVINGFITRGVKVFDTNGAHLRHCAGGMPSLKWGEAISEVFSEEVEEWED